MKEINKKLRFMDRFDPEDPERNAQVFYDEREVEPAYNKIFDEVGNKV